MKIKLLLAFILLAFVTNVSAITTPLKCDATYNSSPFSYAKLIVAPAAPHLDCYYQKGQYGVNAKTITLVPDSKWQAINSYNYECHPMTSDPSACATVAEPY